MHKYIKDEITGRVAFNSKLSSKEIASDLHRYIQSARKENGLHLVITSACARKDEVLFEFCAEHIPKGFLCKKHFIPSRFSIVTVLDFSDSIAGFLKEKSKQVEHYYGTGYGLRIVGQTMNNEDTQTLVCVLAEKSG